TVEGFYRTKPGLEQAISRGLAYAPYADMIWCETGKPDLEFAKKFADAIHKEYPDQLLSYNCSPSFNWKKNLDDATIAGFQNELAAMGYKFQFVTLAGFHTLNLAMFELARGYKQAGMTAYSRLQEKEFLREQQVGYEAVKHQRFVGTGYFDAVQQVITSGTTSTMALEGSTEQAQFTDVVDLLVEKSYNRGNRGGNRGNDSGGASPVESDDLSSDVRSSDDRSSAERVGAATNWPRSDEV